MSANKLGSLPLSLVSRWLYFKLNNSYTTSINIAIRCPYLECPL